MENKFVMVEDVMQMYGVGRPTAEIIVKDVYRKETKKSANRKQRITLSERAVVQWVGGTELLFVTDVAKIFGVSRERAQSLMMRSGKAKNVGAGRRMFVGKEAFEEYMEKLTVM